MNRLNRYITLLLTVVWLPAFAAQAANRYQLMVNHGSGDGRYLYADTVSLIADQPPTGKIFKEWTGTYAWRLTDKDSSSTTFSMPADSTALTATYEDLPYLTVDFGSGDGYFAEDTIVTIVANTPPEGKLFKEWVGSQPARITDTKASLTTFRMTPANTTITATYEDDGNPPVFQNNFSVVATGVNNGQIHTIYIENIRQRSWAQYALWSNNNRHIYFKGGEKFYGAVHANTRLYFWGNPEFFGEVTSAADTFGGSTNNVVFHLGFEYPVEQQSLSDIDFDELKSKAAVIFEGETTITLQGTNMVISNSRAGLVNTVTNIPHNSVIYIEDATTGLPDTRSGNVDIKGNLHERLTIATDGDINITDHLQYVDNPLTNSASLDALGLISKRDVVVKPSCPDNVKIEAHILATGQATTTPYDGSFGVENYYQGPKRGSIYLLGGIAQDYRGAVGTFNRWTGTGTGYDKNYTYDMRFAINPPPEYPPLTNKLIPGLWRDR